MSLFCVWFFFLYEFFLSYFFPFLSGTKGPFSQGQQLGGGGWRGRQTRLGMSVLDGLEKEEEVDDEGSRDMMKEQEQQWTRSKFFREGKRANDSRSIYHHTAANGFLILLFSSLSFLRRLVSVFVLRVAGSSPFSAELSVWFVGEEDEDDGGLVRSSVGVQGG